MNFKNYSQVLSYLQAFYLLVLSRTKALNKLTFHMLHHIIITININVHGGLSNVVRKLVKPVSNRWGMRKLGTKTQNVLDMLQVINHVDT